MSNPLVYDQAAIDDPLVRKLAANMELVVDAVVHDLFPAEVTITCGGKTFTKRTCAHKGSPHNPLTWEDACEKFGRYTRTIIDARQAQDIIAAVAGLERQDDMGRIAALTAKA
jgi:2-methylcitrate dehydratase PrpD